MLGYTPNVAVSQSGVLAYGPDPVAWSRVKRLAWYDRSGNRLEELGEPAHYVGLALSPDDERVAVTIRVQSTADIWLLDQRGVARRMTSGPLNNGSAVWSPAGDKILFQSDRYGSTYDLFVRDLKSPDGSPQQLFEHAASLFPSDWDASGRIWFSTATDGGRDNDIWFWESGAAKPYVATSHREMVARRSPDGRWLAFLSNESGRVEVYVEPFGRVGERRRVSQAGGFSPQWRGDSEELFYLDDEGYIVAARIGPVYAGRAAPERLFQPGALPSDGIRWAYHHFAARSDGEGFLVIEAPERPPSFHYTILLNWQESR